MKNLFDDADRAAISDRVQRLTPETPRRWGTMDAGRMLCHAADQLRLALGDLPTTSGSGLLAWPGVKHVVIYVMPWPKGKVQTAPVLLTTTPSAFEADRAALLALIERFAGQGPDAAWSPHPAFGTLSGRTWGALAARHLDYHLQQFGV